MLLDDDADALREWKAQRETQGVFEELDRLASRLFGPEQAAAMRREREESFRWAGALGQPVMRYQPSMLWLRVNRN